MSYEMKEARERTVAELAAVVKGHVYGDPETLIRGIASIQDAQSGDITFAESLRFLENARQSSASAILAPPLGEKATLSPAIGIGKVLIEVENPRLAFALLLDLFAPERYAARGIHPTAVIGGDFRCGANVTLGANCVLGENVRLGDNVTIHPLVFLGDDVEIGDNVTIHPNVSVLHGTLIGDRSVIHAGAVLGADGYGYMTLGGKHRKVPQIGHVQIGTDVEIGANVTIDRAKTGATRIGDGTKIDNLVHIGHNCQIGEDVLIVAQVGLSGGVTVGRHAILAGQSGVSEQRTIGVGAIIGAQSAVLGDVPDGAFVSGTPARPHKDNLRALAAMHQMPEMIKKLREMEKRLAALEKSGETD